MLFSRSRALRALLPAAAAALLATGATAAPINSVAYGSLTVTGLEDFESLAAGPFPGTNYDSVVDLAGSAYAERFSGQTLGTSGNFDTLGGSPSDPLVLVAGAANQNLVAANAGGVGIAGLGPLGYPDLDANGEGAFSILFDVDSYEFGIEIRGSDGGSATLDFYRRDGSLIDSITLGALSDGFFGFQREASLSDIAGVSITNDDGGGIGFDNVRFQVVPEPSVGALLSLGLLGLGARARRRR